MKVFALVLSLVSFSALAHIQIGTYKGVTAEGTECSVDFKSVTFVTAFKHPIAERVTVVAHGNTYVLQHPVVATEKTVSYNDESLEVGVPFQGGAEFFKVTMSHEEGAEGPESFLHVVHNWKASTVTTFKCSYLTFQK